MIHCSKCGKEIDGAFCKWCGGAAPTTPNDGEAKNKKTENAVLLVFGYTSAILSHSVPFPASLVAILLGIITLRRRKIGHGFLIILLAVTLPFAGTGPQDKTSTSVSGPTPEVISQPVSPPAPQPRHSIGEEVSVGYWSYRCNGGQWQPLIVTGFESVERPDAEFLLIDLWVRNNDRTPSTLPPLKLIDAQGREFNTSSAGTFLPNAFGTLKELNPGVASRGIVVFDAPHGNYMLKVSGGYHSSEDALIDLPNEPKQESGQEPAQP